MNKNNAQSSWYLHRQGQQQGPFDWEKLWAMGQEGSIGAQDLVWQQGMAEWQPAGAVPGCCWVDAGGAKAGGTGGADCEDSSSACKKLTNLIR